MANDRDNALALVDDDTTIVRSDVSSVAVLARSEVEAQLDAAHKYPRSVKRFLNEAIGLATLTREVAESCIYALPRGGKTISGPSVRMAEICASAYGNLHVAARVVDAEDREVIAQGVAWDLEKNLRVTVEARRRITNKSGKRYDDDMITVTGAAAGSIALRNAIFRVVPRAYIDTIYAKIKDVAVGNATTLANRRAEVVSRLMKMGVPQERVFARVGVASVEDIGLDELETLIGLGTAIKNSDRSIDEAFPPLPGPAADTKSLEAELRAKAAPAPSVPTPQAATTETPTAPTEEIKSAEPAPAADTATPLPTWATASVDPRKGTASKTRTREPGED